MSERDAYIINTSGNLIPPEILNGYAPEEIIPSLESYLMWVRNKKFKTQHTLNNGHVEMVYQPKLNPKHPHSILRSFYELPYILATGFSSGEIPETNGDGSLEARATIAYGLTKIAEVLQLSSDGKVEWVDKRWILLKNGNLVHDTKAKIYNSNNEAFDFIGAQFAPFRREMNFRWQETSRLYRKPISKPLIITESSIRFSTLKKYLFNPNRVDCDFEVRQNVWGFDNGWKTRQRGNNLIDELLGDQKHHVEFINGTFHELTTVQEELMDQLGVGNLFCFPHQVPDEFKRR